MFVSYKFVSKNEVNVVHGDQTRMEYELDDYPNVSSGPLGSFRMYSCPSMGLSMSILGQEYIVKRLCVV